MNGSAARFAGFAGLMAVVTLGWILTGRAASPAERGYPTDWSHRHLIFSRPATVEQEVRVSADPRYWQQYERRNIPRTFAGEELNPGSFADYSFGAFAGAQRPGIHRDWSENMGSAATTGAGNYPAKFSFHITTASCSDYVVFNTGLDGSRTQASVVAYNNLYTGCTTGTVPNVYWAYNTGGIALTSPVTSLAGDQVAFVQSNASLQGSLVLLKFAPGGTIAATTLTAVSPGSYRGCTAPCMTTVALKDSGGTPVDDRTSSVFPDYDGDVIWVGGASGWLFKISGVFLGAPAEVRTGAFPIQLNGGASALSSPVFDSTSNDVFVGDLGGIFYQVSATPAGVITTSSSVDHGAGLVAGPIVDSTTSKIYVFASNDGSTNCAGGPCAAVYQFAIGFAFGPAATKAVGTSATSPEPMYEGDFDSDYFSSGVGTGSLYVCGNTGGAPILYKIPITAGTMGTAVAGPRLSSATTATGCSPVTDFSNPNLSGTADEWIFAGVQNSGSGNSCAAGGCLMNFNVQPWKASTAYVVGQQILDIHFQIQTVSRAGTSGTAAPPWSTTVGSITTDLNSPQTMRWINQGRQAAAHPAWIASHAYALAGVILDSNGNVQVVTTKGTSKPGTHPTWSTVVNGSTADGTVRWRNAGLPATVSLAAAGGTSGIIIDNTIPSGTLAGASNVYFSTQSNQACGATGTGGCAVQASQAALK